MITYVTANSHTATYAEVRGVSLEIAYAKATGRKVERVEIGTAEQAAESHGFELDKTVKIIDREISFNEVVATDNADIQFTYAVQGVIDNNEVNDASFSEWQDGAHIAEVYLDGCDIEPGVIAALDEWINEMKEGK